MGIYQKRKKESEPQKINLRLVNIYLKSIRASSKIQQLLEFWSEFFAIKCADKNSVQVTPKGIKLKISKLS